MPMDSAWDTLTGGLPHSEIPGSTIARISPGLFAACHVLHRLSVPRHPPDALILRLSTTPSGKKPRHQTRQFNEDLLGRSGNSKRHRRDRPPRSRHNSLFTMSRDRHPARPKAAGETLVPPKQYPQHLPPALAAPTPLGRLATGALATGGAQRRFERSAGFL